MIKLDELIDRLIAVDNERDRTHLLPLRTRREGRAT
jgi:hypothetical protein